MFDVGKWNNKFDFLEEIFLYKTILYALQNVADDADGPHVGGETDGLEGDNLRSHKLRGPEQDLESNWRAT